MDFEIFKAGKHTSDKGITKEYSIDDLNFIASSYDPKVHEAPIVIGHPKDNSPAYGWVESLWVQGEKLFAKAKDIVPEFLDALKSKLYKKRSISLDNNGKLRHVGFLGGAVPAVKGLTDLQFSDHNFSSFESDFNAEDFLITQEKDNPNETPTSNHTDIYNNSSDYADNSAADTSVPHVSVDQYKELDCLNINLNKPEFESILDSKIASGHITPAVKLKTIELVDYLNTQNFNSFNAEAFQTDIKSILTELISSIPQSFHLQNFAEKPDDDSINFSASYSGLSIDEEASALHKKALSVMKKDNISYIAAVTKISKNKN